MGEAGSQVKFQKILLNECLKSGEEIDRILFLTGMDYPLKPLQEIRNILSSQLKREFILGLNLSNVEGPKKIIDKYTRYYFLKDVNIGNPKLKKLVSRTSTVLAMLLPFKKKRYLEVDDTRWDVWQSSAYMCLTIEAAKYVANMMERKVIYNYFKNSITVDELVIPTILFNSPFKAYASVFQPPYRGLKYLSCLTYFNYGKEIQVFDENDYDELMNSDMMFARKFNSVKSAKLMERIQQNS